MNSHVRTLLLLVSFLTPAGCSTLSRYGGARVADTVDVVPFSIATGVGVLARARATMYFDLGVGWSSTNRVGWRRRVASAETARSELESGGFVPQFPSSLLERGAVSPLPRFDWREETTAIPLIYTKTRYGKPEGEAREAGNSVVVLPVRSSNGLNIADLESEIGSALDLEGEVFLGLIGVRVAVSPAQLFDWLAGLASFDPLADDGPDEDETAQVGEGEVDEVETGDRQ